MRGGGIGASLEAFPIPLGSTDILSNALIAGTFGWTPRKCPVASSWPEARANEAVGEAKITKNMKAIFPVWFTSGKLH